MTCSDAKRVSVSALVSIVVLTVQDADDAEPTVTVLLVPKGVEEGALLCVPSLEDIKLVLLQYLHALEIVMRASDIAPFVTKGMGIRDLS